MAQLTIYLPDDVEKQVKGAARRARKSVSAYVTELAARSVKPKRWPSEFVELFGAWEGSFPEIEDPPPDDPEEA